MCWQRINKRHVLLIGALAILVSLLASQSVVASVPEGTDPNHPIEIALAPYEVTAQVGKLAAGQETWLEVKVTKLHGEMRQPFDLSMFTAPTDGNTLRRVHMELFNQTYAEYWTRNNLEADEAMYFGRGRIVEHENGEGDPILGTQVWSGDVNNNESFFVCLRNDNDFEVSYWLFTDFMEDIELSEPEPAVPVEVAPGTDPNNPLILNDGLNWGELAPGSERWFSMKAADLDDEMMEQQHLTFYFTPNNGYNLHQVGFDVYTSDQCDVWSRGEIDEMVNMGAGSIEAKDNNPETGERFWSGWLVDNDTYYVRLQNNSTVPIAYWLFSDDVLNAELGNMPLE